MQIYVEIFNIRVLCAYTICRLFLTQTLSVPTMHFKLLRRDSFSVARIHLSLAECIGPTWARPNAATPVDN